MPPKTIFFFKLCTGKSSIRRLTSGMVSFFPVLSQGTRAGKKDDTRLYKLPQTTLQPLSESTVASIIPFFGTCFFILTEGLARFTSKNDDFFKLCTGKSSIYRHSFPRFPRSRRYPSYRNGVIFPGSEPGYTRRKER